MNEVPDVGKIFGILDFLSVIGSDLQYGMDSTSHPILLG